MTHASFTASEIETSSVDTLIARLKTAAASNCSVVDASGSWLSGVTLHGDDRTFLVQSIAAQAGMAVIDVDGDTLAETFAEVPEFREVPAAFARARQQLQETGKGVVLYVRDFGKVGARRRSMRVGDDTVATQFMVELYNLQREDVIGIFVIVSMHGEPDLAFVRSGRLPRLENVWPAV